MKIAIAHAKAIYSDRFKRYLFMALLGTFILLIARGDESAKSPLGGSSGLEIHFFFHPQCSHCRKQESFNDWLRQRYPQIRIIRHDVSTPEGQALFRQYARKYRFERLSTPTTLIGTDLYVTGFDADRAHFIERAIQAQLSGTQVSQPAARYGGDAPTRVDVPFIGRIDAAQYSLLSLAIVLGLVDGFNPCAMWVLLYLISLVITLRDRSKVWLLVGTFVMASGLLYFLFLVAWLNAFLLIGYFRPLTLLFGLAAIWIGANNVRDYIAAGGSPHCEVGDTGSRQKMVSRIKSLVVSPLSLGTVLGIIALALMVNSVEFVCSAGLPAIFTHVLANSGVTLPQYYGYVLLYVLCFMLDDLIIFGSAAFATKSIVGTRYSGYSKLLGGFVLLGLGLVLTFIPNLLR